MRRVKVTVTTNGGGVATAYTPRVSGKVHSIHYVKPGSGSFADGVDFVITAEETGEQLWAENNVNASAIRYPRAPTHSPAGAASLYASGGTAVQAPPALGNDRIKIEIGSGGAAKKGDFHILIDN